MMRRITFWDFLIFIILIYISSLQSQVDTLWTKTFGGTDTEYAFTVQQTTDGGYIVVGCTESFGAGGSDIWLIKTDSSGDTLWTKTFGGVSDESGYSVQQTTDGGYVISGYTLSYGADLSDVWLIKTNASGDTLWTKTYGGMDSDCSFSIQQTTDGGYIITGYTFSFGAGGDVWLIKTNSSGDTLWTKTYGGEYNDLGQSVQQTTDEGYIITGNTHLYDVGEYDLWLIKTNLFGDTVWTKKYGGSGSDFGYSVQQTKDGGYIIVGTTYSFGAINGDIWLVKTNSFGDTLWTKTFGGINTEDGFSIQQTTDEGYIISGCAPSFSCNDFDIWLIKTDVSGDILWTKTLGGSGGDCGYSVQQTTDDGYIIVGYTSSFGAGASDIWLIKTTPDVNQIEQNNEKIILDFSLQQNYPNPFNPTTQINYTLPYSNNVSLIIYDLSGKEVQTLVNDYQTAGSYSVDFDASHLSSGIYFYQLKMGNDFVATKKMILTK